MPPELADHLSKMHFPANCWEEMMDPCYQMTTTREMLSGYWIMMNAMTLMEHRGNPTPWKQAFSGLKWIFPGLSVATYNQVTPELSGQSYSSLVLWSGGLGPTDSVVMQCKVSRAFVCIVAIFCPFPSAYFSPPYIVRNCRHLPKWGLSLV